MEYREAYEKALQLLNVRFLSERELRDKLRRRGAADAVLDEVVAALKEEQEKGMAEKSAEFKAGGGEIYVPVDAQQG